jgi:hypothetical protein
LEQGRDAEETSHVAQEGEGVKFCRESVAAQGPVLSNAAS